jgi:D-psicose/D-tagatose/L-ribulose 3-epimerase
MEIAPFTLAEDPATVTAARRREVRGIMASEGLVFAGLHWLMVSPKGLHVTTPDETLRARSWQHIRSLIDLCADLGEDGVMVFGSPKQRTCTGGLTRAEATKNYIDGLIGVSQQAGERGVTILIEALPHQDTDVVLSLKEAVQIVDQINHPAIRTMFDSHNAINETEPHAVLVDRYYDYIHHVHINELDGKHPGTSDYDFYSLFEVLHRRGYKRWVSMEAFDFSPGAETLANESLRHVEIQLAKLEAKSA